MTVDQLIQTLQKEPPDAEVLMEFRFKTGYDQGDIFTATPDEFSTSLVKNQVVVTGLWKLSGGW